MKKQICKNKKGCEDNFEYDGKYEFLEFGWVRFYGYCSKCGHNGWEDFEHSSYDWNEEKSGRNKKILMIKTKDLVGFMDKITLMPTCIEEGKEYKQEIMARLKEWEELRKIPKNRGKELNK